MRESCPRRGPKKGYLKTLQNKIGKNDAQTFYFWLTADEEAKEDLQARLDKQQETPVTENQAFSPCQEGLNTDNEDGSSMENEVQNTAPTTPLTSGNIPQWPAPGGFPFPMIPLGPWECIDNSYSTSPFPALDHCQDPTQIPMEPEIHITPMMHNDL